MRWVENLNFVINSALDEDCFKQDSTTKSLELGDLKIQAVIRVKESGVCAGINIARQIFITVDKKIKFKALIKDGSAFKKGRVLARVYGQASSILAAERTALNFLTRLCGIATLTRQFVDKIKPYKTKILDTRKTTPGLRLLERYAVRMGGGYNHRYNLSDEILIKDNHITAFRKKFKGLRLGSMIEKIKSKQKNKEIEFEVDNLADFKEVITYKPDIIMLDNMNRAQISECVKMRNNLNKKVKLEISGGVNLKNVKQLASLGVDRISIGALTHSPKAIDLSLEFV